MTFVAVGSLESFRHESLGRTSFANEGIIREDQTKAVRGGYVIDGLRASFQEDKEIGFLLRHGLHGLGGKENDFALCDLGDGGNVLRDFGRFKDRVLNLRDVQVQTQSLNARVVGGSIELSKFQHAHEGFQVFFGQCLLNIGNIILFTPRGRQERDGSKDVSIGPCHDCFVGFLELRAQLCHGGAFASSRESNQTNDSTVYSLYTLENDLSYLRWCLPQDINFLVGTRHKVGINDALAFGIINAHLEFFIVFLIASHCQGAFVLGQFHKVGVVSHVRNDCIGSFSILFGEEFQRKGHDPVSEALVAVKMAVLLGRW